jgi:RNA polymerase sigma-70 factor (ECF subfamily)
VPRLVEVRVALHLETVCLAPSGYLNHRASLASELTTELGSPASEQPLTDGELVRRIRAGDERALEVVFRAHFAGMAAFVQRYIHSPDVAEELVQDIFLKVWAKREHLSDIDSLKTYLYRAARNQALNHLRRRRIERAWETRRTQEGEPMTLGAADDDARGQEVAAAVHVAIAKLPDRCREIFTMSRDGGLTYAEIARALGISIKTVETQMGRALKALRLALGGFRS